MISAWWLLLIIPTAFCAGFALCAILGMNARDEECTYCEYRKDR